MAQHFFEGGIHVESNGTVIQAPPNGTWRNIRFDRWAYTSDAQGPNYFSVNNGGLWTVVNIRQPGVYMVTAGVKWASDFPDIHALQIYDGWSVDIFQMNGSPGSGYLASTYQTASIVRRYPLQNYYPSHAGWPGGFPAQVQVGVGNSSGSNQPLQATHNFLDIIQLDSY